MENDKKLEFYMNQTSKVTSLRLIQFHLISKSVSPYEMHMIYTYISDPLLNDVI